MLVEELLHGYQVAWRDARSVFCSFVRSDRMKSALFIFYFLFVSGLPSTCRYIFDVLIYYHVGKKCVENSKKGH